MGAEKDSQLGLKAHWKCALAVTLASMSSFQYGLDFGVIGSLQAMPGFLVVFGHEDPASPIGYNIGPTPQQLISSLMTLGAVIVSLTAGLTAIFAGRKLSLWIACVAVFGSTAMMQAGTTIGVLYAGRFIIGLANGLLMTHSQLYIQECSPAKYRGLAISLFMVWVSIGTLVGTIIDNATAHRLDKGSYIIPLGMVYVVPGILSIGLFFIPESPSWLLSHNDPEQAEKALKWLRPKEWSVAEELEEMITALEAEKSNASGVRFVDLFSSPINRRRTLLSCGVMLCQAASGAVFIISYGTYYFQMAGVKNAFISACALQATGCVAVIVNSFIITKLGRRRVFIMTGQVLCAVTMLIQAAIYTAEPNSGSSGNALVGLTVIYIIGYNGFISSYAWVAAGEFPSQRLRSHTFGLASAIGNFGAWLTSFTAPYFINPEAINWGPKYGYIWTGSCILSLIWVYFYLPETKDRTFQEIDELFEAQLSARKFRKSQCIGHANLEKKASADDEKPAEVTAEQA